MKLFTIGGHCPRCLPLTTGLIVGHVTELLSTQFFGHKRTESHQQRRLAMMSAALSPVGASGSGRTPHLRLVQ